MGRGELGGFHELLNGSLLHAVSALVNRSVSQSVSRLVG